VKKNGLYNGRHKKYRFDCDICDEPFLRKSAMDRHKKYVHKLNRLNETIEIEQIKCQFCPKTFTQKWGLKQHVNRVHKTVRTIVRMTPFLRVN